MQPHSPLDKIHTTPEPLIKFGDTTVSKLATKDNKAWDYEGNEFQGSSFNNEVEKLKGVSHMHTRKMSIYYN